MVLRVVEGGQVRDVPIRAGEILLLPPETPHSPQRPAGSVGLVVERRRRDGELDGLQWYCEQCDTLLYEEFFPLTDIETQFPPVFARFHGNEALRTCRQCHSVLPVPPPAGG
jgi:3-hydroxyanthranilate 3,4-dioxygenase